MTLAVALPVAKGYPHIGPALENARSTIFAHNQAAKPVVRKLVKENRTSSELAKRIVVLQSIC
jgi:hypothetical protein